MTDFRLCKEFGWTPLELARQPAKRIQEFATILEELDKMTEEERVRAEREARLR